MRSRALMGFFLLTSMGCGSAEAPVSSSSVPVSSTDAASVNTDPAGEAASACQAQVVIAFYSAAGCDPSTEVGRRRYDTSQTCFTWTAAGSAAQENSATRFRCYRDRLCYTQHPDSLTCGGGMATDKESRTDRCTKEPAGRLYSRIISGTGSCPPAPAGFECPASSGGQGTREVLACTKG